MFFWFELKNIVTKVLKRKRKNYFNRFVVWVLSVFSLVLWLLRINEIMRRIRTNNWTKEKSFVGKEKQIIFRLSRIAIAFNLIITLAMKTTVTHRLLCRSTHCQRRRPPTVPCLPIQCTVLLSSPGVSSMSSLLDKTNSVINYSVVHEGGKAPIPLKIWGEPIPPPGLWWKFFLLKWLFDFILYSHLR